MSSNSRAQSNAASGWVHSSSPEIVHDVAAAEDEDTALAQRRQLGTQRDVVLEWFGRIDRQLHDRDVSGGEHVHQY